MKPRIKIIPAPLDTEGFNQIFGTRCVLVRADGSEVDIPEVRRIEIDFDCQNGHPMCKLELNAVEVSCVAEAPEIYAELKELYIAPSEGESSE